MQNIVAVLFDVESEGYQAISSLKKNPAPGSFTIMQMALIKKENGKISILENYDTGIDSTDDIVKGGLIGGLLGILGGPVGVLLMGAYGAMAGGLLDMGDAITDSTLIGAVGDKLGDGTVALIIFADESNEYVLDATMKDQFKVEIYRYDAAVVAAEVEEAAEMDLEMQRQALLKLRKDNKEDFKKKVEEKREEISVKVDKFLENAVSSASDRDYD